MYRNMIWEQFAKWWQACEIEFWGVNQPVVRKKGREEILWKKLNCLIFFISIVIKEPDGSIKHKE